MPHKPNRTKLFFIVLWLLLLTGCGDPFIITERPFREPVRSIEIGKTTGAEVHDLLHESLRVDQDSAGHWEVYRDFGGGIGLVLMIPVPSGGWRHFLLVTYDRDGRVSAVDTDKEWSSSESDTVLFAGKYGYYTGLRQAFPSVDGGGKADSAWADYLRMYKYHGRPLSQTYGYIVLDTVCKVAKEEHPCAFKELGNYFWGESHDLIKDDTIVCGANRDTIWEVFEKDNVKACVWYALYNDKALTPWCSDGLSNEEQLQVEQLLLDWQPNHCETDIAPYLCGSNWWTYRLCWPWERSL